ncbi:MAG: response regulator [Deltaproteobacteria bacterium]|nr:response regulator [Deltaproteobacteria bacterium]
MFQLNKIRSFLIITFDDKSLEQQFLKDYYKNSIIRIRIGLLVAITLYLSFGTLDLLLLFFLDTSQVLLMADRKSIMWIIRVAVCCWFLYAIFLSYRTSLKLYYEIFLPVTVYICGLGIIGLVLFSPPLISKIYYAGLLLVVIWGYNFIRMKFYHSSMTVLAITVTYECVAILVNTPKEAIISNNFFLLSSILLGAIACYAMESSVRKNFLLNLQLVKAKDKAEEKNMEIADLLEKQEQKVDERTSELKIAKEEAETANLAKSKFMANMSHELRTPLNAIMGYTQILIHDKEVPENKKNNLNVIKQSSFHLLNMITDILDLTRIEAQKEELILNDFNLPGILTNISDILHMQAKQKKLSFFSQIAPDVPDIVRGDDQKLRQILMNLLNNAVKFTEEGKIVFEVDLHEDKICFQVEDTGIGIASEVLTEIFLPFYQIHQKDQITEGTGLGLAIGSKLARIMNSEIKVESKVGIGSVFRFELELPEITDFVKTNNITKKRVVGYRGERRKILVVDDIEHNRSVLISMLEPLGFKMLEAVNGQDGVDKTNQLEPNLVFIDLRMPVMDGYEAIRQIRTLPIGQKVKIISISASVFDQNRKKSLKAGSNDFIGKPFVLEELLGLIQTHLSLEWTYDEVENNREESVKEIPSTEDLIVPPKEEITALFDLAMRGNINGVLEQANRFERMDKKFIPFSTELRELAQSFKIKKLQEFVKQYLEGTSSS